MKIAAPLATTLILLCNPVLASAADTLPPTATPTPPGPPLTMAPAAQILRAGYIETAKIYPGGIVLEAKLDTGARTSSLGVASYRIYTPDSAKPGDPKQVEFTVNRRDGTSIDYVLPLFRIVRIKEQGRPSSERPVVMMEICIGKILRRTQVNLQKRPRFNYQLLVGRRYLSGRYSVDPSRKNLHPNECPAAGNTPR